MNKGKDEVNGKEKKESRSKNEGKRKNNEFTMITFSGIGSHWWIRIFDEVRDLELLNEDIKALVNTFENNYSRFIKESFISRLNDSKVIENFPQELFNIINFSQDLSSFTLGHFSIFVGSHLENLGYDPKYTFQRKSQKYKKEGNLVEFSKEILKISRDSKVDLGGVGKGWLIDKISNLLKDSGYKYYVVNGGGDIFATSKFGEPIEFILENPFNLSEMIGTISIMDESIACSAPNRRKWIDPKTKNTYHHLVDNLTGESVGKLAAVFTLGKNATSADSASTAIFVSPKNLWTSIAKKLEVEFLSIFEDGSFYMTEKYKGKLN